MANRINSDLIFQTLEPKLQALINKYENEGIYALVICEGVLYIHTEVGLNNKLNQYIEWWDKENQHIASWQQLEERSGKKLDSWEALDRVIKRSYQRKVQDDNPELTAAHKEKLLGLLNKESEGNRRLDIYRSAETREQVRKNVGDWNNEYTIALNGMAGYNEGASAQHYDLSDEAQKVSEYGTGMQALLERIMSSEVMKNAKLTPDFYYRTQEHNY